MAGTNRDSELVAALTVSFLRFSLVVVVVVVVVIVVSRRFHLLKRLSDY